MRTGERHWVFILVALVFVKCVPTYGDDLPNAEPSMLNEVAPLDELWAPAKGGLANRHLKLQIAVPVRTLAKNSQHLPVILWLKNTGDKDIQLIMEKPVLPWHGVIAVKNADGVNIIQQLCHIAKHIPLKDVLKPGEMRAFYINALDQGCAYKPKTDGFKVGRYLVEAPGSNSVTVEVHE